jgi:hypothetical protein
MSLCVLCGSVIEVASLGVLGGSIISRFSFASLCASAVQLFLL